MPSKVQIANQQRAAKAREEAESRVILAIELAGQRGATIAEIAVSARICAKSVYKHLTALRDAERVHIGLWRLQDDRVTAAYYSGPGDDAYRPTMDEMREATLEDEIWAETMGQHRHWAATWKPQRADAVWF